MKHLILFVIGMSLLGCSIPKSKEEKAAAEKELLDNGKYVYLDAENSLHVDLNCYEIHITRGSSSDLNISSPAVRRIRKEELTDSLLNKCCAECVGDDAYEKLRGFLATKGAPKKAVTTAKSRASNLGVIPQKFY